LEGITILDLTRVLAGPFCTQFLGDLGARVIKVERPFTGDDTRQFGPPFVEENSFTPDTGHGKRSTYFMSVNRNKESISVDFKRPEGVRLLKDLAVKSDVFIENYIPGVMDKSGLGFSDIKNHVDKSDPNHKGLTYVSISGFGSDSPRPGYDVIASSVGGLLSLTGPENGDPCRPGVAVVDMITGLYASNGILASLVRRGEKSRKEKHTKVEVDLLSSQISILINVALNFLNYGHTTPRRGTAHDSIVPYQSFGCKPRAGTDKIDYITVIAGSDKMFHKLITILFREEEWKERGRHILEDPKFKTNADRVKNRVELITIIQDVFNTKVREEWMTLLSDSGLPFGAVNTVDEVFQDKEVHDRSILTLDSGFKLLKNAVRFEPPSMMRQEVIQPPLIGQDTDTVFRELLNMSRMEIEKLRSDQVIF
jgi:succinate--hydroxymethylglutarate CoA-transferase